MKSFMFVFAVALLVLSVNLAFAQPQTASVLYTAGIASTPLTLAVTNDVTYDLLRVGVCYTTIADPAPAVSGSPTPNIIPIDFSNPEVFVPGLLEATGTNNAEVAFTFILPTKLYPNGGSGGTGSIDMTYDGHSASWTNVSGGEPTAFFNPLNGLTARLDNSTPGVLDVYLGGNPCVSKDASDLGGVGSTLYNNTALVTCEYTGN